MHTWIPRKVGGLPRKNEALDYWFSEGFADFYAARVLLHSGIWSLEEFVAEENAMLERYGSSTNPLPNTQVLKDFWTSDVVRQVPYDRGRMLATLWDYRLRHDGGKHTLNEVLKQQRVAAQENERNHHDITAGRDPCINADHRNRVGFGLPLQTKRLERAAPPLFWPCFMKSVGNPAEYSAML